MTRHSAIDRIVLGAAALGQPYGIANSQSVISPEETDDVLATAWTRGVRCIDSAPLYGEAEQRIGDWSNTTGKRFRVVSKLPPMQDVPDGEVEEKIRSCVDSTCHNLGIEQLDGYLLHDPDDFGRLHVRQALRMLKAENKIKFSGLSVYRPEDAISALSIDTVDAFQIPVNLFDDRLENSCLSEKCYAAGTRLYWRSIFLQGLIFRDPNTLPRFFKPILPKLRALRSLAAEHQISQTKLALSYVIQTIPHGRIVLGCRHASEVEELCDIAEAPSLDISIIDRLREIGNGTESDMIDPRLWPRLS